MILAFLLALTLCATSLGQVADLAPEWRVRNPDGSCGHCSTKMALNWLGEWDKGRVWWSKYRRGEYWERHLGRLRREGIKYVATSDGDERVLEYAVRSRRGAVTYWPAGHIVNLVGKENGHAVILDNNRIREFGRYEWNNWVQRWRRTSGCAFVILDSYPPPPVPET